jgi:hypothetical protein
MDISEDLPLAGGIIMSALDQKKTHSPENDSIRKPAKSQVYLLLFVVSLFIGLIAGLVSGGPRALLQLTTPPRLFSPLPTPSNGQRNILIIGVDRLENAFPPNENSPRLESIWLVVYFPGQENVSWVPIYPPPTGIKDNFRPSPADLFTLKPNGSPGTALFNLLHVHQIWWSGYILIDEIGLAEALKIMYPEDSGGSPRYGTGELRMIPKPWDNQAAAYLGQSTLLKKLCLQTANASNDVNFTQLKTLIPEHMQTNIDISQLAQEWQQITTSNSRLVCEFPITSENHP